MKNLKDLKKDIDADEKLKEQFLSLKSKEEAVVLAHNMGYDISLEEIENEEEVNEDLLESVAGGKVDTESIDVKVQDIGHGKGSKIVNNANINEELDYFEKLEENYRK